MLIQSIKNDLRRILAKRNSLSLTDINDDDDIPAQYADILLLGNENVMHNGGSSNHPQKTARSLSTLPSGVNDKNVNSKWLKIIGSKATMAIKKSIENLFFG